MHEGMRTGSVIHSARSVGGGAGPRVTAAPQRSPHMLPQRMGGPCTRYRYARSSPVVTAGRTLAACNVALALEDIGWGTAEHWMRMQACSELAQARREKAAAERRADALHA